MTHYGKTMRSARKVTLITRILHVLIVPYANPLPRNHLNSKPPGQYINTHPMRRLCVQRPTVLYYCMPSVCQVNFTRYV